MSAPIRREPFEQVSEPRVPAIARLVGMLTRQQTSLIETFARVYALPFVGAGAIELTVGPLAAAGTFNVLHRLRRIPRGFLVLDAVRASASTGDIAVYRRVGDTRDETTLTLYASAGFESLTLLVWP